MSLLQDHPLVKALPVDLSTFLPWMEEQYQKKGYHNVRHIVYMLNNIPLWDWLNKPVREFQDWTYSHVLTLAILFHDIHPTEASSVTLMRTVLTTMGVSYPPQVGEAIMATVSSRTHEETIKDLNFEDAFLVELIYDLDRIHFTENQSINIFLCLGLWKESGLSLFEFIKERSLFLNRLLEKPIFRSLYFVEHQEGPAREGIERELTFLKDLASNVVLVTYTPH